MQLSQNRSRLNVSETLLNFNLHEGVGFAFGRHFFADSRLEKSHKAAFIQN